MTRCTSFPAWCICLANRYNVFSPSLVSNSSYNSSYALLLAFATSFFASRRISLSSCLLSSSLCISHRFFANLFFRMLSCTSSSHHQVSLSSFLCFDDTPSTFLAVSLTMFAIVVQSSGNSSSLPKARLIFSLNSSQQSSFFNFHHVILGSAFVILRFLVSKVILHTNSRCCLATLSPTITLQSPSGMPSYIWYSPLAYSFHMDNEKWFLQLSTQYSPHCPMYGARWLSWWVKLTTHHQRLN